MTKDEHAHAPQTITLCAACAASQHCGGGTDFLVTRNAAACEAAEHKHPALAIKLTLEIDGKVVDVIDPSADADWQECAVHEHEDLRAAVISTTVTALELLFQRHAPCNAHVDEGCDVSVAEGIPAPGRPR